MLEVIQIPVLEDNYIYLAHEPSEQKTAVIDPALAEPVLRELHNRGWHLDYIFNTHHHWDHVDGNLELKAKTGCTIIGPKPDFTRIPGIDLQVDEGDTVRLGAATAKVIFTPGHTRGHIVYWFEDAKALFVGDTLFAMGCGRLFEGTPAQMWSSLSRLKNLPGETKFYCAHEYTETNARFALSVDPGNPELLERFEQVTQQRRQGVPTVPATLALELQTNPFLRPTAAGILQSLGLPANTSPEQAFAEVRRRKDQFMN